MLRCGGWLGHIENPEFRKC